MNTSDDGLCDLRSFSNPDGKAKKRYAEVECGGLTRTIWRIILQYSSAEDKIRMLSLTCPTMLLLVRDPFAWSNVVMPLSKLSRLRAWYPAWSWATKLKMTNELIPGDLAER